MGEARKKYDALPWSSQIPVALGDAFRIGANGVSFGLADKFADAVVTRPGQKTAAAQTADARDRAGIAGDVGNLLGMGGGLKMAWQGMKAIPKMAGAVMSKKGLAAGGLGVGGLVSYNARTNAEGAAPKKAAAPAMATTETLGSRRRAATPAGPAAAAPNAAATYFDQMIKNLADGQNGEISLNQLGALSEAAQRGAAANGVKKGSIPKVGDEAGRMLEEMMIARFNKSLSDPEADPMVAADEFRKEALELRKTGLIDPYGLSDGQQN